MEKKCIAEFNYNGKKYVRCRELSKFDRNYSDEMYGYFIEQLDENKSLDDTKVFEINVLKDDNGEFISDGYVAVYDYYCDSAPIETIKCKLTLKR